MPSSRQNEQQSKRGRLRLLAIPVAAAALYGAWRLIGPGGAGDALAGTTFIATRAPLEITVLEGGTIEAIESQQIKSEVQGQTKILTLIEEGYQVTAEDVANGLVLVELDSKALQDQLIERELDYQNASATLTEARESYEIQLNQNESDVKASELDVRFARMDLERFLGETATREILALRAAEASVEPPPAAGEDEAPLNGPAPRPNEALVDFTRYANPDRLGDGEAQQRLRKLENDMVLAGEEVGLAQTQLEGTQRLFERDFITRNDLDNDQLRLRRQEIASESAETSKELFIKYEFPKEAERLLSNYEESLRKLERTHRLAVSRLAQAEAKLKSAEARYALQLRRRDEVKDQIEKCVIRAEREGLVVYGGGEDRWRNEDQIQEGATVRERQVIITIPDTTQMGVNVKVHESFVQRIARGQQARIRVDANPDTALSGEVIRVGLLPDSQSRWLSPDIKVYSTQVAIRESAPWIRPGLSAQVEIIAEVLPSVVQIPIQAVQRREGKTVCYVTRAGFSAERREIEVGAFNAAMIEVRSGLREGETVLLRPPAWDQPAEEPRQADESAAPEAPAAEAA